MKPIYIAMSAFGIICIALASMLAGNKTAINAIVGIGIGYVLITGALIVADILKYWEDQDRK